MLTRLPVSSRWFEGLGERRLADGLWSFPLVGVIVGSIGGIGLMAASSFGLHPLTCALIAFGLVMVATGALHEDGLADVLDGFGGAGSAKDKLKIMKDSRIGSFGVLGLVVAVGLKVTALATLLGPRDGGGGTGCGRGGFTCCHGNGDVGFGTRSQRWAWEDGGNAKDSDGPDRSWARGGRCLHMPAVAGPPCWGLSRHSSVLLYYVFWPSVKLGASPGMYWVLRKWWRRFLFCLQPPGPRNGIDLMHESTKTVVTRWWWVRHAPVTGMVGKLYGSDDVPCDCSDTVAFGRLAEALPKGAHWVTSHLSRTKDTARAIQDAGLEGMVPDEHVDLGEQCFGNWQGLTWSEIAETQAVASKTFWRDPTRNAAPGGESFFDQIERCGVRINALNKAEGGRDIIAVTHGGTIRAALAHALSLEPESAMGLIIDNLSITRIDHLTVPALNGKGSSWRVLGVNLPTMKGSGLDRYHQQNTGGH